MPQRRAQRSAAASPSIPLAFRLDSGVLGLEVADQAALTLVTHAYAAMQVDAAGVKMRAYLHRLSDGRIHVRYGRQILHAAGAGSAPLPLGSAYHAAREVFARFAAEAPETLALYGALCAVDGGAVLLLGPTMIGKTVLALHLAIAGARFLGDETAAISLRDGEMYAMPRRPALRESALPLLPQAIARGVARSECAFENGRGRFWYSLDETALDGIEPSARRYPVRAVCVINDRGEGASLRSLEPVQALKAVAQRAYGRPSSLAHVAAIRRAMRHAAFFELTLGPPEETSRLLLRELRSCG